MRILLLILSALLHGGGPDHDAAPPPYGPPSWAYTLTPEKDALLCSFVDCPPGTHCEILSRPGLDPDAPLGEKAHAGWRAICAVEFEPT